MNNAVESFFNENFAEKRDLWVPWIIHRTHKNALLQKKKKKKKRRRRLKEVLSKRVLSLVANNLGE